MFVLKTYIRLAFQNALRKKTRTLFLIMAIAIATATIYASYLVARGIDQSIQQSFSRMGADLIIVPENTMINITSALLTVQPTEEKINSDILEKIKLIKGIDKISTQTYFKVSMMPGMPKHKVNLIAFEPNTDFTIMPWLSNKLNRKFEKGDLLAGARIEDKIGDEEEPFNQACLIYGKLAISGVGPLDESYFTTYETMLSLLNKQRNIKSETPNFLNNDQIYYSALLVRLKEGYTPEQIRFALSSIPGIKVVCGPRIVTTTRQANKILISGLLTSSTVILLSIYILIFLIFSAIVEERHKELGLLRAMGSKSKHILFMLLSESSLSTSLGGFCGILLGIGILLIFQHSLVFYLESLQLEFCWPNINEIIVTTICCLVASFFLGLLAAMFPCLRINSIDPQNLIQSGNN